MRLYTKEHWKAKQSKIIISNEQITSIDEGIEREIGGEEEILCDNTQNAIPTGYVVEVTNTDNRRPYVCTVDSYSITKKEYFIIFIHSFLAVPMDIRIPKIRVISSNGSLLVGERIVVIIDEFLENTFYPIGHFTRVLGKIGDSSTEIYSLCIEHQVFIIIMYYKL